MWDHCITGAKLKFFILFNNSIQYFNFPAISSGGEKYEVREEGDLALLGHVKENQLLIYFKS